MAKFMRKYFFQTMVVGNNFVRELYGRAAVFVPIRTTSCAPQLLAPDDLYTSCRRSYLSAGNLIIQFTKKFVGKFVSFC